MVIEMLLNNATLYHAIKEQTLDDVLDILEELKNVSGRCVLSESNYEKLIDFIYTNHRREDCIQLSRMLEKEMARKHIIMDGQRYQSEKEKLDKCIQTEAKSLKEILDEDGAFDFSYPVVSCEEHKAMRCISHVCELQNILVIFGNAIESIKEFVSYLTFIYKELVFDDKIEDSIEHLEAGFVYRRKEILYHLYCIEKEIPALLLKYGPMDNQTLGSKMSIPCSPERSRKTVKIELTKQTDQAELVCEMHTKMKKIGTRPPDRIYFCARVPKGITIDGKNIEEKSYVYKITKHAGFSKKKK